MTRTPEWLLGSTNIDEDFHYSSYFIRGALTGEWAYSEILSHYDGWDERYYVRGNEAEALSQSLTRSLDESSSLADDLVADIEDRLRALAELLPASRALGLGTVTQGWYDFYQAFFRRLTLLYEVARVPEVLDRGRPWFTDTLRRRFADRSGMSIDDAGAALAQAFAKSRHGSPVADALRERERLLEMVRRDALASGLPITSGYLHQVVSGRTLDEIDSYLERWGYIWYHGYQSRREMDSDTFLEYATRVLESERPRAAVWSMEREVPSPVALPPEVAHLSSAYASFATVKLRRRLVQLQFFPAIDRLFAVLARRTGATERALRFLLPEEVLSVLERDFALSSELRTTIDARAQDGAVFRWSGKTVELLSSEHLVGKLRGLEHGHRHGPGDLRGEPVSGGLALGVVVHADRNVPELERIERPFVLVSRATDLDMLDTMIEAEAIITERGGVTSHAASVCRDLGLVAVVGVPSAMRVLPQGTPVQVDGRTGIVRQLQ